MHCMQFIMQVHCYVAMVLNPHKSCCMYETSTLNIFFVSLNIFNVFIYYIFNINTLCKSFALHIFYYTSKLMSCAQLLLCEIFPSKHRKWTVVCVFFFNFILTTFSLHISKISKWFRNNCILSGKRYPTLYKFTNRSQVDVSEHVKTITNLYYLRYCPNLSPECQFISFYSLNECVCVISNILVPQSVHLFPVLGFSIYIYR